MSEAKARIKINKLLEAAGWRMLPDDGKPANVCLEQGTTMTLDDVWALGDDFQDTQKGYIDFLLLNEKGYPFIVLEAKREEKDPLDGKEQARKYARSQNCRFVILSNGNLHYFWDLERGNPYIITSFPTPESVTTFEKKVPDPSRLVSEDVNDDYIALTQRPNYASEAGWLNEAERPDYIKTNKLRFLRPYQLQAVHSIQRAVKDDKDRLASPVESNSSSIPVHAHAVRPYSKAGRPFCDGHRTENGFIESPACLRNPPPAPGNPASDRLGDRSRAAAGGIQPRTHRAHGAEDRRHPRPHLGRAAGTGH